MPKFHAITRAVSPALAECALTHIERTAIDFEKAVAEHSAYEKILAALGATVERLPGDTALPDCVFIEDTAVVADEFALITRPGSPSRQNETAAVERALQRYRPVTAMVGPGTLDGGDVLRIGRTFFVGLGTRTNPDGVRQLARVAKPHGYHVQGVSFGDCLHLKTGVTLVSDDLLLINPQWVDPKLFPGLRVINVAADEPFAANALRLGDTIVHGGGYPKTTESLRQLGLKVQTANLPELAKAEGGVTCCSLIFSSETK